MDNRFLSKSICIYLFIFLYNSKRNNYENLKFSLNYLPVDNPSTEYNSAILQIIKFIPTTKHWFATEIVYR